MTLDLHGVPPGSTLRLEAGEHVLVGPARLPEGVRLVGAGRDKTRIRCRLDPDRVTGPCPDLLAGSGTIEHLGFDYCGDRGVGSLLFCDEGTLRLHHVAVTGAKKGRDNGNGVAAEGTGRLEMSGCRLSGHEGIAVLVGVGASAELRDCRFDRNVGGAWAWGDAALEVLGCRFERGSYAAFRVGGRATGTLRDSHVLRHTNSPALDVVEHGVAAILDTLVDRARLGLAVGGGHVQVRGCTFRRCRIHGISTSGTPVLIAEDNRIEDSSSCGVHVAHCDRVELRRNHVARSTVDGIHVDTDRPVILEDNSFEDNGCDDVAWSTDEPAEGPGWPMPSGDYELRGYLVDPAELEALVGSGDTAARRRIEITQRPRLDEDEELGDGSLGAELRALLDEGVETPGALELLCAHVGDVTEHPSLWMGARWVGGLGLPELFLEAQARVPPDEAPELLAALRALDLDEEEARTVVRVLVQWLERAGDRTLFSFFG